MGREHGAGPLGPRIRGILATSCLTIAWTCRWEEPFRVAAAGTVPTVKAAVMAANVIEMVLFLLFTLLSRVW